MGKVLYKTKFGKPIIEGKKYVTVLKDGKIMDTIAREGNEDPNVIERFLSRTGAEKFVKNLNKKPIKTLEEDKLKSLSPLEQLDYVNDESDFKAWLKRNKFSITSNSNGLVISSSTLTLISFGFSWRAGFSCCGAREMGSHSGGIDPTSSRFLTEDRLKVLCSYITKDFEKACRTGADNYGIVSYVVNPGEISQPSARLGYLMDASDMFIRGSRFKNPNSSRLLDMYIISDKWMTN